MNILVAHIAAGLSFYSGTCVLLISVATRHRCVKTWVRITNTFAMLTGLAFVACSSTPLPVWFWVMGTTSAIAVLNCRIHRRRFTYLFATVWSMAMIHEAMYLQTPRVTESPTLTRRPVVVVADSLTAGLGEDEAVTWPALLQQHKTVKVIDVSHVGETAGSALKRIQKANIPPNAVVLIEIGGNDLLGATSVEDYDTHLNRLLQYVASPGRTVVLFEIPLPPFHGRWASIARRAAKRHDAKLIHRRRLAGVLAGQTSTLDSVHLTQEGHNRMLAITQYILKLSN